MSQDNPRAFTAARVVRLLNLAADACSQSDLVSSHVKGELLFLLDQLKREEALRLLERESAGTGPGPDFPP